MNKLYVSLFLAGALFVFAGVLFAMQGATVGSATFLTRWTSSASGTVVTEGGNISAQDITANSLTDKWAGMYGNVSGSIYLTDSASGIGSPLYSWSVSDPSSGVICASTDSSYSFAAVAAGTAAQIDAEYNFASAADNATNTFVGTDGLAMSEATIAGAAAVTHKGSSNFKTSVVNDGSTGSKDNLAYCTTLQSTSAGKTYSNQSANYELIVPVDFGPATTETYSFYAQLN
jgi:hypothetical protein